MKPRILVVDDEKNITLVISAMLVKAGFDPIVLNESEKVMETLDRENVNALITDLYMPGLTGMDLIGLVQRKHPQK